MTASIFSRRGRPRLVAQTTSKDLVLPYYDNFYDACEKLRYRDIMALSRALNVHSRTVEAWKYREKKPSFRKMLEVMDWIQAGKPMELQPSSQEARLHSAC